jgi:hypothetical protein
VPLNSPSTGVGELAVDLDMMLAGQRVPVRIVGRTGVAQHAVEVHRQELGQQFLFLELVGPAGAEQTGPIGQLPAQRLDPRRASRTRPDARGSRPDETAVWRRQAKQIPPFDCAGTGDDCSVRRQHAIDKTGVSERRTDTVDASVTIRQT